MIPTIHILSNPIGTVGKLLYTNSQFLSVDKLKAPGARKKDIEFLVESALQRQNNTRFTKTLQKYKWYMDELHNSLSEFNGKEIVFLDYENLLLESEFGTFTRRGIDDFSSLTETVPTLIKELYLPFSKEGKDFLRDITFWRMSPYDMPFSIIDRDDLGIEHSLKEKVNEINEYFRREEKKPLGATIRLLEDTKTPEHYSFSSFFYSESEFNKFISYKPSLINLFNVYKSSASSDYIDSLNDFVRVNKAAIRLNRAILKQKYNTILDHCSTEQSKQSTPSLWAYMLQGHHGLKHLQSIPGYEELPVIGEKVLQNTKNLPQRDILEDQALNRFSGWIQSRLNDPTSVLKPKPVIINQTSEKKEIPHFETSKKHPYLITLGKTKQIEDAIRDNIDPHDLYLLENDISQLNYSVSSAEVILLLLNYSNYRVHTDTVDTQWKFARENDKVIPYDISHLNSTLDADTRSSNTGVFCEFHQFINLLPKFFLEPVANDSDLARIGTTLHSITNELHSDDYRLLPNYGIEAIPRDKYAEVKIVYSYNPTNEEWNDAKAQFLERYKKTGKYFFLYASEEVDRMKKTKKSILTGGHPDIVFKLKDSKIPIVVDIKRRMNMYYPVQYQFEQTCRYGIGIHQLDSLEKQGVDKMYSIIVHTPFNPNKFVQEKQYLDGDFRKQVFRIREIPFDSDFAHQTKINNIKEAVNISLFKEDKSLGYDLRNLYANSFGKPSCKHCFANMDISPLCRFVLEHEKKVWD